MSGEVIYTFYVLFMCLHFYRLKESNRSFEVRNFVDEKKNLSS